MVPSKLECKERLQALASGIRHMHQTRVKQRRSAATQAMQVPGVWA